MAASVTLSSEAEQDLANAGDWYVRNRPGRETKFLERVNDSITTICRVPRGGRPLHGKYRQAVVRHFPYIVVYSFDDAANAVTVHAVFHTSQDPQKLLDRLP